MENILDLTREELSEWLDSKGIRPYRANQIFKWLYLKLAQDFDQMTDLGKELRQTLKDHFTIGNMILEQREVSADTTEKFLFRLGDGTYMETVLIPEKDHFTLCVSSQVGCAMACKFCLTARNGFTRNLTMGEIVGQVREARAQVQNMGYDPLRLSNIVFMGMGEPLANYDNVLRSLAVILDTDFGMKFATRRVTISTSGLVPKIIQLGQDTDVNLAVSLNATDNKTRSRLMPINDTYPIEDLLGACKKFAMKPRNKITFEYILMAGINDSFAHARQLADLLMPLRAKVNLIPFNEHEAAPFKRPSREKINGFLQVLLDRNMTAIVRKSKGDDISAACGQLKAKYQA
ncbi:MAG: 23S rRNA (adenine(2503)-C(2))-methyltransferase RlmN [Desulfobacter sp.]|nr:23S rRNA (adenine(2503)-C(2))-methyltransferase RlmN [Desulfobacter sp.]WDP85737.1 MAG: 23S rRNA (adenine(2503)-C(2))-methyltransferase RlmN [Desulfobacter sp.]